FRVSGGVFEQFDLIERASQDAAFLHDYGADGSFFRFVSPRCLAQGFAHEIVVALEIDDGVSHTQSNLRHFLPASTHSSHRFGSGSAPQKNLRGAARTMARFARGQFGEYLIGPGSRAERIETALRDVPAARASIAV